MRWLICVWMVSCVALACGDSGSANADANGRKSDGGLNPRPGDGPSWLDTPLAELPAALSDVGLFRALPDSDDVSARAIAYAPQYPLWSNGSVKTRFLVLPKGETIDTDSDPWVFPEGTLFFKTFAFEGDDGVLHNRETRVLRAKQDDGWDYAAYRWNDAGTDAERLEGKTATKLDVMHEGEAFEHQIPSRRQCRECHESSSSFVLGFNPLQLSYADDDGDESLLERLDAAGVFSSHPQAVELEASDSETRFIEGYVAGNCVHCHNGSGLSNSAFDMRPDVFVENTLDRETESSASGIGTRIVPGAAEQSVLYLGFTGRDNDTGIKAMPPVGVQLRDAQTAERLKAWIDGL